MKALIVLGCGSTSGIPRPAHRKGSWDIRLGYLNDAMLPFAGEDFAGTERGRLEQLGYRPRTITAGEIGSADEFAAILDELDALYVRWRDLRSAGESATARARRRTRP